MSVCKQTKGFLFPSGCLWLLPNTLHDGWLLPAELSALKTPAIKNLGHIPNEALKNVLF